MSESSRASRLARICLKAFSSAADYPDRLSRGHVPLFTDDEDMSERLSLQQQKSHAFIPMLTRMSLQHQSKPVWLSRSHIPLFHCRPECLFSIRASQVGYHEVTRLSSTVDQNVSLASEQARLVITKSHAFIPLSTRMSL